MHFTIKTLFLLSLLVTLASTRWLKTLAQHALYHPLSGPVVFSYPAQNVLLYWFPTFQIHVLVFRLNMENIKTKNNNHGRYCSLLRQSTLIQLIQILWWMSFFFSWQNVWTIGNCLMNKNLSIYKLHVRLHYSEKFS